MATVELSFTPLPAHVRTARLVATTVARRTGVEESLLDEVRLAVGEACSRAVEAHRLHCPGEPVRVQLSEQGGRFEVVVADAASGDPASGDAAAGDSAGAAAAGGGGGGGGVSSGGAVGGAVSGAVGAVSPGGAVGAMPGSTAAGTGPRDVGPGPGGAGAGPGDGPAPGGGGAGLAGAGTGPGGAGAAPGGAGAGPTSKFIAANGVVSLDSDADGGFPAGLGLAVIAGLADDVEISATATGVSIRMSWPAHGAHRPG